MNLSLILNMPAGTAPASPASGTAVQGQITAEMASFQDFLSLMGLSPMAAEGAEDLSDGEATAGDPAALAAMLPDETGNLLPPGLPVLPDLAAAHVEGALPVQSIISGTTATINPAASDQPSRSQPRSAPAVPFVTQPQSPLAPASGAAPGASSVAATSLPVPPETLAAAQAEAVQPTRSQPAAAQASIAFDLPLPAAAQAQPQSSTQPAVQQVAAQPVLAQLLQANARPAPRNGVPETAPAPAALADTADIPAEVVRPVAPVPAIATAAMTAAAPDAVANSVAPPAAPAAPAAERHDFTAVIDKLAEARELARPGRADMHVAHREFGQVSVQFELAGQALKVAMTSADPGFAPAVQQALADRPVAPVADAARADSQPQRGDSASASSASWQAGPQADGQRQDGQGRAQQARPGHAPVHTNDGDADSTGGSTLARDSSRFA